MTTAVSRVDLVRVFTPTVGAAPLQLGDALVGARGVEALTDGSIYAYYATEGAGWEQGTGTYSAESATLTRVVDHSSAGGAAIALHGAGVVTFTIRAQDLVAPADVAGKLDHVDPDALNHALSSGWMGDTIAFRLDGSADSQNAANQAALYDPLRPRTAAQPANPGGVNHQVFNEHVLARRVVAPRIGHVPTGNAADYTFASLVIQTSSVQVDNREFTLSVGMEAYTGKDNTNGMLGRGDKIAGYFGTIAHYGSYNVWSKNELTTLNSDASTLVAGWVNEMDMNNLLKHTGDTPGATSYHASGNTTQPFIRGLDITGASTFRCTAALSVGHLTGTGWNRGFVADQAHQEAFADYSNAIWSHRIEGSHAYGIDTRFGSFSGAAIRLGQTDALKFRNSADSADVAVLTYSSGGVTSIGAETAVAISVPLTVKKGTNPDSTGQPAGNFAATVYNATNASGENGLLVKHNWATASARALEVGGDLVGGAYASVFTVRGDQAVLARGKAVQVVESYTVATVPSVSDTLHPTGSQVFVSNESGGAVIAFNDGTNWRRVTDRAVIS